ncbi:MAG TPA: iron-sulfur cluster assembly accessory protein [Nitrospinota bacterium]|jgi:iron-sulfur cluster assembly accessory protein|nr:iron-sulfur cluster assembly accessory protein [Nitrospinota bacterium]
MFSVTENAAEQIKKVQVNMKAEEKCLRISVVNGGCNGNQYQMDFDTDSDGDTKINSNGVTILVDKHSVPLITGMNLDYVERLEGSTFVFNNPNATGGCGCGQSFST